jgi:cytochrome c-type biogenesis protein
LDVQVSIPLALAAGFVSFLSPCILPVVPGYLGFSSALTLDELSRESVARARRGAVLHSVLFMFGFGLVFLSLGFVPTAVGPVIVRSLPWIQRTGGVLLALYGLHLLGVFAFLNPNGAPMSTRTSTTVRGVGALLTGVTFGAGWTPCIGPVLGSILLYVSREQTMGQGVMLLGTYAVGLSAPFIATSVGLNWPLAGSRSVGLRAVPLRRLAGLVLAALGTSMVTGYFARVTAFLAGLGQLINLELS